MTCRKKSLFSSNKLLGTSRMNRKLEALLIVASIGGGFMGVSIVLAELLKVSYFTLGHFLIFGSALTLFGYFIYAGLVFASNNENNKHLKITFLLQIPWVSSPVLVYKIAAGFSLSGLFHAGGLYYLTSNQVATVPNKKINKNSLLSSAFATHFSQLLLSLLFGRYIYNYLSSLRRHLSCYMNFHSQK